MFDGPKRGKKEGGRSSNTAHEKVRTKTKTNRQSQDNEKKMAPVTIIRSDVKNRGPSQPKKKYGGKGNKRKKLGVVVS